MNENPINMDSVKTKKVPGALIATGGVIIILVLAVFFFLRDSDDHSMKMREENQTNTSSVPKEGAPSSSGEEDIVTINMEAGSFYYSVKEIRVKEGQKVRIVMTSKDMMHDLRIDELEVKSDVVKAGDTSTVEFLANKKGVFEYYCSIGNGYHRKMGQVGKITIE